MNANQTPQPRLDLENEHRKVLASSHTEFQAALAKSAEVLRGAISAAQQSIATQLAREAAGQAPSTMTGAPETLLNALTGDIVDEAFKLAKGMLDEIERNSASNQPPSFTPQATLPVDAAGAPPADPLAAADFFMTRAAESLNTAMNAVVQASAPQYQSPDEQPFGPEIRKL